MSQTDCGGQFLWIVGFLLFRGDVILWMHWFLVLVKKDNSFQICFQRGCKFVGESIKKLLYMYLSATHEFKNLIFFFNVNYMKL